MRRACQILCLVLFANGLAFASGITGCMLNSLSMNLNQCYSANTFFTTPLTLNWQTAFGKANLSNPNNFSSTPWDTNIAGVNIGVTAGADYTMTGPSTTSTTGAAQLARVNNEVYVWDSTHSAWIIPEFSMAPSLHTDITYDGHFGAPGPSAPNGDGAHLLEMYDGAGSYVISFDQGMSAAGLLVSVQGSGFNTNFDATIKAYDKNSNLLATYVINTTGVGGQCASLNNNPPTACNDAPFLGIKAPGDLTSQQIYKIVVTANSGGVLDSMLLDSLQFQIAAPEPAMIFLCGGGLVLIGVLRRKRLSAGPTR